MVADLTTNPAAASTFTYDANGNIASATDPLGRTTSFTYNALGQRLTMTRSAGANSTPESGSASPLLQQAAVSPTQGIRSKTMVVTRKPGAQLNALAHSQDSLSPLGGNTCNPPTPPIYSVTDFYSAMYGIKSEIDSLGRTSSETYDANGNVATYTDANGNVYSYSYDALNRLTQVNLPTNPVTSYTFTYDYANHVIDTTDPEGHDRHNVYDLAGRLTSVTLGYGTSSATKTSFAYYDDGTLQSATDNAGHTTNYTYDPAGNLTQVARGPVSVQYAYDNDRNRISATDGNGNTTSFQYDANQRLQQIGFADHTSQSIAYDSSGNVTGVTDQAGHTINYQYDNANRVLGVTQANSSFTSNNTGGFCRDGFGNLSSWTDENGHVLSQTADAIGRPTGITYPDGASSLAGSYDFNSNLLSLSKSSTSGTTTAQFTYDNLNRLTSQTPDPSSGEVPAQFTYTANGQLSTMADATGPTSYTYDSLDRLITKSTPAGTLNYTYDAAGNVAGMTSTGANSVSVSYTYDELNRLSTVVDNNLPSGQNTTTYTYDSASNLATATYPNGLRSTYSYDQLNRLSGASTPVSSYQYSRDNNGNIVTASEAGGRTATYTYDGIDELTSETVANDPANINGAVNYTLDSVGNRLSDTSSLAPLASFSSPFNADDQPQSESYDANGDTVVTGSNTFTYNSWLKLVSMNGGQVTLAYNGLGQLVSKTTSSGTTQYLIDDLSPTGYPQVVEELQGGAVTRTYTYGLDRISQLQPVNTNGTNTWTPSFYVYDGRGTVRMLTDSAGAVTDTYAYDAFGNLLAQTGSTPNVHLYRGERWDQDLGLYYLRARWYNPITGRFMSRDPYSGSIWDPASLHRYNYARANPVNYIDPSGRANLTDYALNLSNRLAAAVVVTAVGIQVKCYYGAIGAMIAIIAESPYMTKEQASILSAQIDPSVGACWAKVTYQQFAKDTLLNLGFGYAIDGIGWLLEGAAAGEAPLLENTPKDLCCNTPKPRFYVTPEGTAIPSTGYRAILADNLDAAVNGNIMSRSGTTYITFTDISGMSPAQVQDVLQIRYTPVAYAQFDTMQLVDDLSTPMDNWNTGTTPEPIVQSFPKYGNGGATQAITTTLIQGYGLFIF